MMNGGGTPVLLLRLSGIFAFLLSSSSVTFLFQFPFHSFGLFTSFRFFTLYYTQNCHDFYRWRDERHDYDDTTVMSHEYDDARTHDLLVAGEPDTAQALNSLVDRMMKTEEKIERKCLQVIIANIE